MNGRYTMRLLMCNNEKIYGCPHLSLIISSYTSVVEYILCFSIHVVSSFGSNTNGILYCKLFKKCTKNTDVIH